MNAGRSGGCNSSIMICIRSALKIAKLKDREFADFPYLSSEKALSVYTARLV
jgi:hypothetical protein